MSEFKKAFGFVLGITLGLVAGDIVLKGYNSMTKSKKTTEEKSEETEE